MGEPSKLDKVFQIVMIRFIETGQAPHYTVPNHPTRLGSLPLFSRKLRNKPVLSTLAVASPMLLPEGRCPRHLKEPKPLNMKRGSRRS